MSDIYQPLTQQERKKAEDSFLEFLRHRDGTPEPGEHRLSKREEYFKAIDVKPVRSKRNVNLATFNRNHVATKIEPGLDELMLWLLCTAKLNRSERYGVDVAMAHRSHKGSINSNSPLTFIELEEFYHTRMLLDVLKVFGLEIEILPPASRVSRLIINSMVYLPQRFSIPLTLAGEIFGVTAFYLLREKAKELLAGEPEVLERVLSLYNEIMVDEIGHVFFARTRAGKPGLWLAKKFLPVITDSILAELPEMLQLFGKEKLQATINQLDSILNSNEDWPVSPFRYQPGAARLTSN